MTAVLASCRRVAGRSSGLDGFLERPELALGGVALLRQGPCHLDLTVRLPVSELPPRSDPEAQGGHRLWGSQHQMGEGSCWVLQASATPSRRRADAALPCLGCGSLSSPRHRVPALLWSPSPARVRTCLVRPWYCDVQTQAALFVVSTSRGGASPDARALRDLRPLFIL